MRWPSKDMLARIVRWNIPTTNKTALLAGVWTGAAINVAMIPEIERYMRNKPDLTFFFMGLGFFLPLYLFVWETSPNPFFPGNGGRGLGNLKRTFIWLSAAGVICATGSFLHRSDSTDERLLFAAQTETLPDNGSDAVPWQQWRNQTQAAILDSYENDHFAPTRCEPGTHGLLQASIDDHGVIASWRVYASSGCPLLDQHMLQAADAALARLPRSPRHSTLLTLPFAQR